MYLLDTNSISYLFKKNPNLVRNLLQVPANQIVTCSIVLSELFYGASLNPELESKLMAYYESFFEDVIIFGYDSLEAREFAKIKSRLKSKGQIIEDFDIMIAAVCLANGLTLVTNNLKHFKNIPGLEVVDWTKV
jgi:tRNA(fMet)-specific endonuclease VapC